MSKRLSLMEAWEKMDFEGPARECPKWLEELAEEYPHLERLCDEWRKPMTVPLELALLGAADELREYRKNETT